MSETGWGGRRPNTGPKQRRIQLDPETAEQLAEVVADWQMPGGAEDVVAALILAEYKAMRVRQAEELLAQAKAELRKG